MSRWVANVWSSQEKGNAEVFTLQFMTESLKAYRKFF